MSQDKGLGTTGLMVVDQYWVVGHFVPGHERQIKSVYVSLMTHWETTI